MSENFKKLTGKNPQEYEFAASSLINNADENLFCELVEKDDFLFDFIKDNVVKRLSKVCNQSNFRNLLKFLKYYSPTYEEFIVTTLVKYADEDLTDTMLEIFDKGTNDEKTYCAKFFSYIQDPLAIEYLKQNSYSADSFLSFNCASTLGVFKDKDSYNSAIEKLNSEDEFEQLAGAKFLVGYGDKSVCNTLIESAKTSPMAENIVSLIPYLCPLTDIIKNNQIDGLYVLNLIISGLGETVPLSTLFDFNIAETVKYLKNNINSAVAVVLFNARIKFEELTDDDIYLYDETKEVKSDVFEIKEILESIPADIELLSDEELREDSIFVFTALQNTSNVDKVKKLLSSSNQTIVLKSAEILKELNEFNSEDKETALKHVYSEHIKQIVNAL